MKSLRKITIYGSIFDKKHDFHIKSSSWRLNIFQFDHIFFFRQIEEFRKNLLRVGSSFVSQQVKNSIPSHFAIGSIMSHSNVQLKLQKVQNAVIVSVVRRKDDIRYINREIFFLQRQRLIPRRRQKLKFDISQRINCQQNKRYVQELDGMKNNSEKNHSRIHIIWLTWF